MIAKFLRFILLISLIAGLAACTPAATPTVAPTTAPPKAEPTVVRIGTQPWIGYGPWWIAREKGLFEKYNLKVELVDFVQDSDVNAALASNHMEAANLATHTAIKLFSTGLDIRIILLEDASYEADAILAGGNINSMADLKGKPIAYEEGTTSDLLLNYALSQNQMSLADIQPVPMPASDAGAALISGKVQSAVTYEPYITEALQQNKDLKRLYSAKERPGLISDVLVIRTSFLEKNPEAARALLKVWDEAMAFYKSNPEEAKAIIAQNVGSKPEELVTAFDGVVFFNLADNQAQLKGDFLKTIQDVAGVAKNIGLFSEIPDLNKLIDASVSAQ